MKRFFHVAVPLVFFALLMLCSCSNAQQLYEKGNYQAAINKLDKTPNPSVSDYLLKARCHIENGEEEKALSSLLLYLMIEEDSNAADHIYAVSHFLNVNTSDKLAVMVIKDTDGFEALKALYGAYSRLNDLDNAKRILEKLSDLMDFNGFVNLILTDPVDSGYILDIFYAWYSTISDNEYDNYLTALNRFSKVQMNETVAKRALSLTDVLMTNDYYTSENIRLSLLLKIKGNILEKLFDKVNARIYWSQAYKLNPEDEELGKRLQ